jgi:hypothetical protein
MQWNQRGIPNFRLQLVHIEEPGLFYNALTFLSHYDHHERSLACHNVQVSQCALRFNDQTMPIGKLHATVDFYRCDLQPESCI